VDAVTDCAFCEIVENPASWVWHHGDDVVSIRPFGAVNDGHRMFIPVQHVVDAAEDPAVTARCFEAAAAWAKSQEPEGFNLVANAGEVGDQTVFHLHVHYVPRAEDDGLGYRWTA
jgi:histidine triad (HIT) family protein